MIVKIIILMLLIVLNGIFSATEMAFIKVNTYELKKQLRKKNKKAKKILALLKDSSTFLSAIQIVITLSGFLASAFAADSFAREIAYMITIPWLTKEALINILIVLITFILSYFTLVFGELVPKRLALIYPEKISYSMVNILNVVIILFKPFIFILGASTNFILRLLKIKEKEEIAEEEIKSSIVDANLESLEKRMLLNVFEFNDTTVKDVMTKKDKVIFIDMYSTKEQILNKIKEEKYTRFPVLKDGEVVGVLNIKDLLKKRQSRFELKSYIRPIEVVSSDMIIDDAFLYLNSKHEPIAKVVKDDKWVGIVTLEDIIEEVIGNIFDEYDKENE